MIIGVKRTNSYYERLRRKKFIEEYKLEKGCSVCGYNESPEALDLDHIDRSQKRFKLSQGFKYTWEIMMAEIEKCVVLCAICHRKKTQAEKDYLHQNYEEDETSKLQYDLFGGTDENKT